MLPPYVAVIYDLNTHNPLRVYWNLDYEDGSHMFTIQPGPGEGISILPKAEVRGMQLDALAKYAVTKRTGV